MIQPIPDGLICLTFDDGVKSQHRFVVPLLEELGFGGTFYISEGLRFLEDKTRYMTWEEIVDLDARGFEVGNHTRAHKNVNEQTPDELRADIDHIDARCRAYGITHPTTFCYPGYRNGPAAVEVLRDRGFAFARRGTDPEFTYNGEGGCGPAYDPTRHDPLLVPTTGAVGPAYSLDDFKCPLIRRRRARFACLLITACPISIMLGFTSIPTYSPPICAIYRTMPVRSSPCATSSATCLWSERIVHLRPVCKRTIDGATG